MSRVLLAVAGQISRMGRGVRLDWPFAEVK